MNALRLSRIATGFALLSFAVFPSVLAAQQTSSGSSSQTASGSSRPARVRANLSGFDLSAQSGSKGGTQVGAGGIAAPRTEVGGASRGLGSYSLYAPKLAKAFSTTPTFHWGGADEDTKFTFRLTTASGQVVYEKAVSGDHFTYPADAPALSPGSTYDWTIQPEIDLFGAPPAPVGVMVVGGDERAGIEAALKQTNGNGPDAELARAKVFVDKRVWYDALDAYDRLLAEHPDRRDVYAQRGELYDQLPATQALAEKDFAASHRSQ